MEKLLEREEESKVPVMWLIVALLVCLVYSLLISQARVVHNQIIANSTVVVLDSRNMSFSEIYTVTLKSLGCNPVYGIKYQMGDPVDKSTDWLECTKDPIVVDGYKVWPGVQVK